LVGEFYLVLIQPAGGDPRRERSGTVAEKIQKSVGFDGELWAWVQAQADAEKRSVSNWLEVQIEKLKEKTNGISK
jgi:hypothetical protein